MWTGALYVAEQCCKWIQQGFSRLADYSIQLASDCVRLLNKIFELLGKLAKKFISGYGQVLSIFEWVSSGFEDTPYIHEAQQIANFITQAINLYDNLRNLVSNFEGYLANANKIKDAVFELPTIDNTHDAVELGRTLRTSSHAMSEQRQNIDSSRKGIQSTLDGLRDRHR